MYSFCQTADYKLQRIPSKVRGACLPQEYELSRFITDIRNPDISWNTLIHACKWEGVTCDEKFIVVNIKWDKQMYSSRKKLEGSPRWQYLLRTVLKFTVAHGQLTGEVPLDTLPPDLTDFNAFSNEFTGEVNLCHLPYTLGQLLLFSNWFHGNVDLTCLSKNLYGLLLHENNLSGEINLTSLPASMLVINLSRNQFTGSLDLQHLPLEVDTVDCSYNRFSGVVLFDDLPPQLTELEP